MRFRSQAYAGQVLNLVGQVILAFVFSGMYGYYWYWVFPVFLLLLLPRAKREAWVVVDEIGVKLGNKTAISWVDIESLTKRGWTRAIFTLKDGRRKSLSTFDWPVESRDEFYRLLEKKGLS